MARLGPTRLHHAQHRIEPVAPCIVHQAFALRMGQAHPQSQAGTTGFQGRQQVLACDESVGVLAGSIVALVTAPVVY